MSIENRGENKWRFRIRKNGISYSQNFYGTEKEAEKAHKAFEVDIMRGNVGYNENMKFADLAELCLKEYYSNLKVSTQQNAAAPLKNHILPYFGSMKIDSIKTIHVQMFINDLKDKYKANTVNHIANVLFRILNLAVEWDIIKESPATKAKKMPKEKRGGQELLTLEEIKKLFDIYRKEKNLLQKSAFYLAACCGLRNSEIRALTLDDIDFKNNTINISKQIGDIKIGDKITQGVITTKTKSSNRVVYAPGFVMQCLNDYVKSLPYIPVSKQIYWSHVTRQPITKHCLSKKFTTVLKNNDLPQIRFHDLRHIHATLLISANVNVQAVSKRLGHSNLQITADTYIHNIQEVDKLSADIFENYVKQLEAK